MNSVIKIIKYPSAWVPIVIPMIFLAYIVITITFFTIVRERDEGIGAHLFQFWLVLEPFMVGYFTFTWLPRAPKETLAILTLQIISALLLIYSVFSLNL